MRFPVILEKTLDDLVKLRRMAILVVVGAALTVLMVYLMGSGGDMSLEMQTQMVLDYFSMFVFLWTTGFVLAMTVATAGAGFIAKEHDDGTLLLLVSKPINRFEIVLGKFLALMISSILLQGVTLSACIVGSIISRSICW